MNRKDIMGMSYIVGDATQPSGEGLKLIVHAFTMMVCPIVDQVLVRGGVAVTVYDLRTAPDRDRVRAFFQTILRHTPESQVRRGLALASTTPPETLLADVARALGNGSLVTAPDTVPFCLWMAAHHLDQFVEAIGKTISAGGDCDTNAAIVGGIVALSVGCNGIPADWLKARESVEV